MSGHLSNRPPITPRSALNRLSLMCVVAWSLLVATSLAEHRHDGQWGPAQLVASANPR